MTHHSRLLICGLLALLALQTACENQSMKECPTCPNNTSCLQGDCGCNPDHHDMDNWCLLKNDNLFLATSLDCPCLDVLGLYLIDIKPENGTVQLPKSTYTIRQPKNPYSGQNANFYYYQRPGGDSIAIYNLPGPGIVGFYTCGIRDSLYCEIDILGKFHGADTIQATVFYNRCVNNENAASNHQETKHLTFVRKQ
jgi:hypothetical protein